MKINTGALKDLGIFGWQAASEDNPDTVIRLGKRLGHVGTVKLTTTKDDKPYKLIRFSKNKNANNDVRTAFRNTVAELFGGENHIPENVKTAMKLNDYGKGRPLTARRITAVHTAIVDALLGSDELQDENGKLCKMHEVRVDLRLHYMHQDSPEAFNEKLRESLTGDPISKLPEGIREALTDMINELSARIGMDPLTDESTFTDYARNIKDILSPVINQASKERRRLTGEDIVNAFREHCEKNIIGGHLQKTIDNILAENNIPKGYTGRAFIRDNPDCLEDLRQSTSPEDFNTRVAAWKDRITAACKYSSEIDKITTNLPKLLQAKIEEGVGLPEGALKDKIKLQTFNTKIRFAKDELMNNFAQGISLSAEELKNKFMDLANQYAQIYIDKCKEVDECDISTDLAKRWKMEIITHHKPKEYTPKKYCEVAKNLGGQELLNALRKKNNTRKAILAMNEFAQKLDKECVKMAGGTKVWMIDLGMEGRTDAIRAIIQVMIDKNPALGEALASRYEELAAEYDKVLPEKMMNIGNIFCRTVLDKINFEHLEK